MLLGTFKGNIVTYFNIGSSQQKGRSTMRGLTPKHSLSAHKQPYRG